MQHSRNQASTADWSRRPQHQPRKTCARGRGGLEEPSADSLWFHLLTCSVPPPCACQRVLTQVSTFIVLAKEQAEQEQLARNQQRQQYGLHHMGSYGFPQQQAFLPQQQPQQLQHQGSVTYHTVPGGMNVMPVAAWSSAAGAGAAAGTMQSTYMLTPSAGSMAVMPSMVQHASPAQQQAAPQMWAAMGAGMSPIMQQQQVGVQVVGAMAGGTYVNMAGQYPANNYMVGQQQGMCELASPAGPGASAAMLVAPQQHQQLQQFFLNLMPPCSMPAQHDGIAAGFPQGQLSPVSNALSVLPVGIGGQQELLQQHSPAHMTGAEGSHSACGVGSNMFVRDMLNSLNCAAAGHNTSPPGALQQPQPQQGGVYVPQGLTWVPVEGTATSSAGTAPAASWAMPQAPMGNGQAFPAAGLPEASPSFSAASSTSTSASTGFALPRMCAASSSACA